MFTYLMDLVEKVVMATSIAVGVGITYVVHRTGFSQYIVNNSLTETGDMFGGFEYVKICMAVVLSAVPGLMAGAITHDGIYVLLEDS
jgi:hypothetical protein